MGLYQSFQNFTDTDSRPNTFPYIRSKEKKTALGKTIEWTRTAVGNTLRFALNFPTNLARTAIFIPVKDTVNSVMSVINPVRFNK
jgi:hypothetical protein